jgi:hypothetical protein
VTARLDLTGRRFGRWVVLGNPTSDGKRLYWLCRCDCGIERVVASNNLCSGGSVSCGCWQRKVVTRHGNTSVHGKTPEYRVWSGMRCRCTNPRSNRFASYGGRGIVVCERWQVFENFLEDMGPRPSPRHSIDRINNNGNYEPSNCRWATPSEQSRNQRSTRLNEQLVREIRAARTSGETLASIAKRLGVHPMTVKSAATGQSWRDVQ